MNRKRKIYAQNLLQKGSFGAAILYQSSTRRGAGGRARAEIANTVHVRILPGDTADALANRIPPVEHALYPEALAKACESIKARA